MKLKRRLMSILLSLTLAVSFMPAMTFAAAGDETNDPAASEEQVTGEESSDEEGSAEDIVIDDADGEQGSVEDIVTENVEDPEEAEDPEGAEETEASDEPESSEETAVLRSPAGAKGGGDGNIDDPDDPGEEADDLDDPKDRDDEGVYEFVADGAYKNDRGEYVVYSDGNLTLRINGEVGIDEGKTLDLNVGTVDQTDSGFQWNYFDENCYSFDEEHMTLTLYGSEILAHGFRGGSFNILAGTLPDGWMAQGFCEFRIAQEPEYDREWDRNLLPGWDGDVYGYYNVNADCAAFPDYHESYPVTSVEIISGGDLLSEKNEGHNDGGYWFHYRAGDTQGTVELKVNYKDVYDADKYYTFKLNIVGDVFDIDIRSDEGLYEALPGKSITLHADGMHKYIVEENGRREQREDSEGLSYQWSFDWGSEYATLTPDPNDSSTVTLTFNELPNGVNQIDEEVRVRATLYYTAEGEDPEEKNSRSESYLVRSEYTELLPLQLDGIDVGETINYVPEVRHYSLDCEEQEGYEVVEGVNYAFWFDENTFTIKDSEETVVADTGEGNPENNLSTGPFTFTRNENNDSKIQVAAFHNGQRISDREYRFNRNDYGTWFDEHDVEVYTDAYDYPGDPDVIFPSMTLNTDNLGDNWEDRLDYVLKVGTGHWINEGTDHQEWVFDDEFTLGTEYTFAKEDGRWTVSLEKSYLESLRNWTDVRVVFELYKKGGAQSGEGCLNDTDMWFHVNKAHVDYDYEGNQDKLPGWEGDINGSYRVWVKNAKYPQGKDSRYNIENVTVTTGEDLLRYGPTRDQDENDPNNYWWHYEIKNGVSGTITFSVDVANNEYGIEDYTFDVNVVSDVFELDMWSEGSVYEGLPGSEIVLRARGVHKYLKQNSDGSCDYPEDDIGLSYEWGLETGGEYATLTADQNDPARAVLRFKDLPAGSGGIDEEVRVYVKLFYTPEGGTAQEKSYRSDNYRVKSEYQTLWPLELPADLDVGATISYEPEVRQYSLDCEEPGGYETLGLVGYAFWYDTNAFTIINMNTGAAVPNAGDFEDPKDATAEGPFTIVRKGDWDSDIGVGAFRNGEEIEHRDYHFNNRDYWVEFYRHDVEVYTDAYDYEDDPDVDAETSMWLNTDRLGEDWKDRFDYVLTVGTGHWENEGTNNQEWVYDNELTIGEDYTVENDGYMTVRLNKPYLESLNEWADVRVLFELYPNDSEHTGENRLRDTDMWFHVKKAYIDVEYEEDEDKLPGWGGKIDGSCRLWIENAKYPWREEFRYYVKDVTVDDQEGILWGPLQKKVDENDPNNYWWEYETREGKFGTVTFNVEVEDNDWGIDDYSFDVHFGGDVFELNMWSVGSEYEGLPGDSITLQASGIHKYMVQQNGWTDYPEDTIGLSYEWGLEHGGEYATLTAYPTDPSKATLTFKALPEGRDEIDEEVRVYVKLFYTPEGEGTEAQEKCCRVENYRVRSEYQTLWPLEIKKDLDVGASVEFDPEVRVYKVGEAVRVEETDGFAFWYDTNALTIKDVNGNEVPDAGSFDKPKDHLAEGPFTIERKGDWDTEIGVGAFRDGDDIEHRDYHLDNMNYDIWFDKDQGIVFTDSTLSFKLSTDALPEDWAERYDLSFEVGPADWDQENQTVAWIGEPFNVSDGKYTVSGNTVTLIGSELEEFKDTGMWLCVLAELKLKNSDRFLAFNTAWAEVREGIIDPTDATGYEITLLPGEDGEIWDEGGVYVQNTEYPDGHYFGSDVTGVTVVSGGELLEGGDVVKHDEGEDHFWKYTVKNWADGFEYGDVVLRVTYKCAELFGDAENSYDFTIHVRNETYYLEVYSSDGNYTGVPGDVIGLEANAFRKYVDNNGDVQETSDGLIFEWIVERGSEFGVLEADGSKARVTLKYERDNTRFHEDIVVNVRIRDTNHSDAVAGEFRTDLSVTSDYMKIAVAPELDKTLDVGSAATYRPVLLSCDMYSEPTESGEEVQFRVFFSGSLEIVDGNGSPVAHGDVIQTDTFTVIRTDFGDAAFGLRAEEPGFSFDNGKRIYGFNEFYIPNKSYDAHIDADESIRLSVDDANGAYVVPFALDGFDKIANDGSVRYEVKAFTADPAKLDGDTATGEDFIELGEDTIKSLSVNTSGKLEVTVDATKIPYKANAGTASEFIIDRILFKVTAVRTMPNGSELALCEGAGFGRPVYVNWTCFTLGHEYGELIPEIAPTCTVTGFKAHYVCARCGKLFDTEKTETTAVELTIPAKNHSWGKWKVTKKATLKAAGQYKRVCANDSTHYETKVIAKNNMTAKAKSKILKIKAGKKVTIKPSKAYKITNNKGKLTYKLKKGDKKITVAKNGKITIKKGLKTGKTYKVKVTVTSAATAEYAKVVKNITLKIKVE